MRETEQKNVPITDLLEMYPFLKEWTFPPSAYLLENSGRKLPSAEERIRLLGGSEDIIKRVNDVPNKSRDQYVILLACRQNPIVGHEIRRFLKLVDYRLPWDKTYRTLYTSEADGFLERREDIIRISVERQIAIVKHNLIGYQTTGSGIQQVAELSIGRIYPGLIKGVVPETS